MSYVITGRFFFTLAVRSKTGGDLFRSRAATLATTVAGPFPVYARLFRPTISPETFRNIPAVTTGRRRRIARSSVIRELVNPFYNNNVFRLRSTAVMSAAKRFAPREHEETYCARKSPRGNRPSYIVRPRER